ncbi:hypothetical protein QOZ80_4AG0302170 [Eleusine coracana subsp. coracana]|nr:hypothetical protein QOZ80_4AG0302170 [Eleusine coracana subsp. coracana]
MASFAAQLKDLFYVLVERVTGYDRQAAGEQEPAKMASSDDVPQIDEEVMVVKHTEIRARSKNLEPFVPDGSKSQVN